MPIKTSKLKSHSAGSAKKRSKKSASKIRPLSAQCDRREIDILSRAAMENIYYISHNAVDCLEFRGFRWPMAGKAKKGKKSKKTKSKK
ncbi:small lysine-rich protein 1 [Scleropages formosus]|uniref:small lysine-rich protein 1 n=1 Tax=Scleropages formosus TaxID=113540 RepID=UPI00087882EB|nr:small lysine-rich protein 1 [Scleropages formosus]